MNRTRLLLTLLFATPLHSNISIQHSIYGMFINDNPKLIVDWSPKAGCTSAWTMLMKNYGLLEAALSYSPWVHNYRENIYHKQHIVTQEKFFNPTYYKIKFVRNPYERAVSSYLEACKKTSFKGSFEEFLSRVKENSWHGLTSHEIHHIMAHSHKQYKITDKFMHEIIRIEQADLTRVNAATGLNLVLTKHDSHHHNQYTSCDQYCGDQPYIKLECYPDYHCYYSQKTFKLVEELYHVDIAAYNYQIPKKIAQFLARTS